MAFAAVGVIPDKWLFFAAGHPHATADERDDWRLRLDDPNAEWEAIPACPVNPRHLVSATAANGKFYVFGGARQDPFLFEIREMLARDHGLSGIVPWNADVNFRDAYSYDPDTNAWTTLRGTPVGMLSGDLVPVGGRYLLVMGSSHRPSARVGGDNGRQWSGYWDMIFCYDVEQNRYSRIGVMLYGVATSPCALHDGKLYSFGGEPTHGENLNTENVLQIGTLVWTND